MLFISIQKTLPWFKPKALLMPEEIWKAVPDFEGLYQVSNWGRIRRTKDRRLIVSRFDKERYCIVHLTKNGKQRSKKFHRLVATVYVPNPENKAQVNHKNGIKHHNYAWNLEWTTQQENRYHAVNVLGIKYGGKIIPSKVICLTTGVIYTDIKAAAKAFNMKSGTLQKKITEYGGNIKKAGLKFSYYEEGKGYVIPPLTSELIVRMKMFQLKTNQSLLAKSLGISQAEFHRRIAGKRKPNVAFFKALQKELNIEDDQLLKLI